MVVLVSGFYGEGIIAFLKSNENCNIRTNLRYSLTHDNPITHRASSL